MGFDICFTNAPARTRSLYVVNINADLPCQSSNVRRSGHGCSVLGTRHLVELSWHGEAGRQWLWLVGWKRLFFRFPFGLDGGLKCEACSVLPGNVLNGDMFGPLGRNGSSTFEREDDLADLDFLALLDTNFFNHSADGRRNFDDRFVSLDRKSVV